MLFKDQLYLEPNTKNLIIKLSSSENTLLPSFQFLLNKRGHQRPVDCGWASAVLPALECLKSPGPVLSYLTLVMKYGGGWGWGVTEHKNTGEISFK